MRPARLGLLLGVLVAAVSPVSSAKDSLQPYRGSDAVTLTSLKGSSIGLFRGKEASARIVSVDGRHRRAPYPPFTEHVTVNPGKARIGVEVWSARRLRPPDTGFACISLSLMPATEYQFLAVPVDGGFELRVTQIFGDLEEPVLTLTIPRSGMGGAVDACH